jgi:uncharacterized protein GlcG (DUF336 family)
LWRALDASGTAAPGGVAKIDFDQAITRLVCASSGLASVSREPDRIHNTETIMIKAITGGLAVALAFTFSGAAQAQAYGAPISLDAAKKAVAASMAESKKNNWTMAVAVVDPGGALIYFERQDATQTGSAVVAVDKAVSAVTYKRPTKVFEDIVSGGGNGLRILGLRGAVPIEGGIPIVMDGKVVGAIGASGGSAQQDGMVAKAGIEALK